MNLYAGSEHSFELPEHRPDGAAAANVNRFDKRIPDKHLINLDDKKMFLNRNLIYESAASLSGLPANQSNGQLNGRSNRSHMNGSQLNGQLNGQCNQMNSNPLNGNQLNSNQLNGSQISQLNHHVTQLNGSQLNQLNGQLIGQDSKPNNQIITGNAYSNYPFVHDTTMATGRLSNWNSSFSVILVILF